MIAKSDTMRRPFGCPPIPCGPRRGGEPSVILGIDVGGTHTDAVCIEDGRIRSYAKTLTGDDLVASVVDAIERLDAACPKVKRVVLSTTLSTNVIVEGKHPPTGVVCSAGPGIDPGTFSVGTCFRHVAGAMDHRGREYIPIDPAEVMDAASTLERAGCQGVAIVSKFSVRNPAHEDAIASLVGSRFRHVCLGHTLSGALNFPRRINTTYLNAAVMPVQERFISAVASAVERLGIQAPLYFLKADGGTYTQDAARRFPVETILSGPAASVMGALALAPSRDASVLVIDIGGTTTDIGVLVGGLPLLDTWGVAIGGLKTLVRGLKVISIGVGGDSCISVEDDGTIAVGPRRDGMPACMGGPSATPMDALVILGEYAGDTARALDAVRALALKAGMDIEPFCRKVIGVMVDAVHGAAKAFMEEINAHPVYTIYEMLHPHVVKPEGVVLVGGPAALLAEYVSRSFGLPCHVPEHAGVANALGAALSRTTAQITLHADTELGVLFCPELGFKAAAPRSMTLEDLRHEGLRLLRENASYLGLEDSAEAQVIQQQAFTMVRGFSTVGANMRVRVQNTPGIIDSWGGLG